MQTQLTEAFETYRPGRRISEEALFNMTNLAALIEAESSIPCAKAARILGIKSDVCNLYARRLERIGWVTTYKEHGALILDYVGPPGR